MSKEMEKTYNKRFEEIKHTDETGMEFWYARESYNMCWIIKNGENLKM